MSNYSTLGYNPQTSKTIQIVIPNNATNEDVIKALFSGRDYSIIEDRLCHTMWWNTPYKKGE